MARFDQASQAPTPTATTPAPGAPVATPAPVIAGDLIRTVPTSAAEVRALRAQRSELSDQLISATNRREEWAKEYESATGANRAGIQARLEVLDTRIAQIEQEIALTGRLLAQAPGQYLTSTPFTPAGGPPMDITGIVAILTVFIAFPLVMVYVRNMWRRGAPRVESAIERDNADRLARLESAVDSIAVEVERISEGQRFVTKLLAESEQRAGARLERGAP